MNKSILILIVASVLISCGEYQQLLKSTDPELKYTKAVEYFEKKDFMRATTLFDEVAKYYRGTERSEEVLNYLAGSYMGQKDYYTASEYYRTYVKTYPKGKYITDARFMIGYCYYLDSPDARLDQQATNDAITSFQEFLDLHPDSERVPEVNRLMDEMKDKLAQKELLSSRLYYNLGNYLGNNYLSAIITAQNALEEFPNNKYREELLFIVLQSKFEQAVQSVEEKKMERYRDTVDEYYNFINEHPEGEYRKQADRIFNEARKVVKE
jgi:outer membrane protein assembly factor BamD